MSEYETSECPHCGAFQYPDGTYGHDVVKARQELQALAEASAEFNHVFRRLKLIVTANMFMCFVVGAIVGFFIARIGR